MTTARARHYPDQPPIDLVLRGPRCEHGELEGRCALCRMAAEPPYDQDSPEPATPRSPRRRPRRPRKPDEDLAPGQLF